MSDAVELTLFDLGGVLCRFTPARRLAAFARRTGIPEAEVRQRLWDSRISARGDRGEFDLEEMCASVNGALGTHLSRSELQTLWSYAFELDERVLAVAQDISRRMTVGMLTNNAPILLAALPEHFPELASVFDPVLFSFQFEAVKPEAELFLRVQDRVGRDGSAIRLIDDSLANVEAARHAGWQAIHFTDPERLLAELS